MEEANVPWGCELTPLFNSLNPAFPAKRKYPMVRFPELPKCPRCSAFPNKYLQFTKKGKVRCPLCFFEYDIPPQYLSPAYRFSSPELFNDVYDVLNFGEGLFFCLLCFLL